MFADMRYNTIEQITHAIRRDEWTREQFIDALRIAGSPEAPLLVCRTDRDLLTEVAASHFGISKAEFDQNYSAGQRQ